MMRPLAKICGVCMAQSPERSTPGHHLPGVARFTVSGIGEAMPAAPTSRARAMQRAINSGVTSGRAPSWMATNSLPLLPICCKPIQTDSCRSSPPGSTRPWRTPFRDQRLHLRNVVFLRHHDDLVNLRRVAESLDGMPQHRLAGERREEFVEAHAATAAGGDDDGGNHDRERRSGVKSAELGGDGGTERLPSARPATFCVASFITAPICALDVAPASAIAASTSAASSSALIACSR